MVDKVRKEDILGIKSGCSKTFNLPSYESCLSARAYVSQLNRTHPRTDVERYQCSINREKSSVIITAIKREVL